MKQHRQPLPDEREQPAEAVGGRPSRRRVSRWARVGLLVLAWAALAGCATTGTHGRRMHVQGHWTVGAVFSEFVPLGAKTSYEFVDTGLPPAFLRYQEKLPSHADDSSQNGRARSVYMDFEGEVYRDPQISPDAPVIRVLKLYSYGPPKADFLRSRKPH